MDIHQLRVFLDLSECLNLSFVAEKYFTSRQAIRYSIKSLEHELQTGLIETGGNAITLTPDGQELAVMARSALESYYALQRDYSRVSMDSPATLTVNFDAAIMSKRDLLSDLCVHLYDSGIKSLNVSEKPCNWCLESVVNRSCDVAIARFDRNHFQDCGVKVVHMHRFALLVSRQSPLAVKAAIEPQDLNNLQLVTRSGFTSRAQSFIQKCRKANINLAIEIEANDPRAACELVAKNLAALVTSTIDDRVYDLGKYVLIPLADPSVIWYDCVIYPRGDSRQRGVDTIISFLEQDPYSALPTVLQEYLVESGDI